jgi:hypothetical protein
MLEYKKMAMALYEKDVMKLEEIITNKDKAQAL